MLDAALGYAGTPILEAVDLDLAPGTLTLVTGATGSGKSSLLHAMSGLFQHFSEGEQRGTIEVGGADRATTPPRETAGFVGVVPQSARLSFVAEKVVDELGFALAVRGVAPVIVRDRAAEIARHLGIEHLLERDVRALSAGEAGLVALGAALVSRPVLLVVDEPLAELDAAARARVVDALDRLRPRGRRVRRRRRAPRSRVRVRVRARRGCSARAPRRWSAGGARRGGPARERGGARAGGDRSGTAAGQHPSRHGRPRDRDRRRLTSAWRWPAANSSRCAAPTVPGSRACCTQSHGRPSATSSSSMVGMSRP